MYKLVNGVEVALSEQEILEFQEREAAHALKQQEYLLVKYKDLRKSEYPTVDELLVALIEKEEGRPEALNALMVQRLQVKSKYPKPS